MKSASVSIIVSSFIEKSAVHNRCNGGLKCSSRTAAYDSESKETVTREATVKFPHCQFERLYTNIRMILSTD
jgi:hypothetical protein